MTLSTNSAKYPAQILKATTGPNGATIARQPPPLRMCSQGAHRRSAGVQFTWTVRGLKRIGPIQVAGEQVPKLGDRRFVWEGPLRHDLDVVFGPNHEDILAFDHRDWLRPLVAGALAIAAK